jgi:hypothetical protein
MDKYTIAANVALAQLDGFAGRLTAAQQRKLFGRNIFGRKQLTIDASGQGRVYGYYSVAFGTDSAFFSKSFDEISQLANEPDSILHF